MADTPEPSNPVPPCEGNVDGQYPLCKLESVGAGSLPKEATPYGPVLKVIRRSPTTGPCRLLADLCLHQNALATTWLATELHFRVKRVSMVELLLFLWLLRGQLL